MPEKPPSAAPLHARKTHDPEDKRKRDAEAGVVHAVAGAMAGEAIAAVAGKGKKPKG
jgi:hypothetical protein